MLLILNVFSVHSSWSWGGEHYGGTAATLAPGYPEQGSGYIGNAEEHEGGKVGWLAGVDGRQAPRSAGKGGI